MISVHISLSRNLNRLISCLSNFYSCDDDGAGCSVFVENFSSRRRRNSDAKSAEPDDGVAAYCPALEITSSACSSLPISSIFTCSSRCREVEVVIVADGELADVEGPDVGAGEEDDVGVESGAKVVAK